MSGPDFTELLSTSKLGEIEKPKPLPPGSYVALVKRQEYDKSSKKQTPLARFYLEVQSAMEDVDAEALAAFGDVKGKTLKHDLYITESSLFMLQDFVLNHIGLDLEGKSLEEAIPECVNQLVGVRVKNEIAQDGETTYATLEGTFNPED